MPQNNRKIPNLPHCVVLVASKLSKLVRDLFDPQLPLALTSYIALWISTLLIFGRCIYRVAELQGGFDSEIANHEASFIVLESAFIALAASLLTVLHPGPVFRSAWSAANWTFRTKPKTSQAQDSNKEFTWVPGFSKVSKICVGRTNSDSCVPVWLFRL